MSRFLDRQALDLPVFDRQALRRVARLEPLEPRLVLSADPLGPIRIDYLVDEISQQVEQMLDYELGAALADAHAQTGLDAVRNTYGLTGAGQTVAVIDSGIAWDHIALGGGFGANYHVVGGWDFAEDDAIPYDDGPFGSHGTHVAGIIGSTNGTNLGVAPGADLVSLRVFDDNGDGYFSWVEQALQWVHDHRNDFANPITAINLSLGTDWNSDTVPDWAMLEDEFAQLEEDGIFIAVAAGNSFADFNEPGLSYPAASEYVVPVSALDPGGGFSYFSQRHDRAIAAPGRWITSTVPDYVGNQNGINDDFSSYSGTSMASPYVAGASVLLREAMQSVGWTDITQDDIYGVMMDTAQSFWDTETSGWYKQLDMQAAVEWVMANPLVQMPDFDDLGQVAFTSMDNVTVNGVKWYRVEAANGGTLTVETFGTGATDVALFDEGMQQLASNTGAGGEARLDYDVAAGQVFYVQVAGNNSLDLRLTNLVNLEGTTLEVTGTAENDTISFRAGSSYQLVVNGVSYRFASGDVSKILITGGNGEDSLTLTGTSGSENAILRLGRTDFTGAGFDLTATSFEQVLIHGGGGADMARLFDSAGNDTFVGKPTQSRMYGGGFDHRVVGFERVYAYAAGGDDKAELYGTSGDEEFKAHPGDARLVGGEFYLLANGFDRVYVYGNGGYDFAKLYDSSGDDLFKVSPGNARLLGDGFAHYVVEFDRVNAYASTGDDVAKLIDGEGDDVFQAGPADVRMAGEGYYHYGKGFGRVYAYGSGGDDLAKLFDSDGDDHFEATPSEARLQNDVSFFEVQGFDRVRAHASGGFDTAEFYDSPSNDRFKSGPGSSKMYGDGFYNYARYFDRVSAYASEGFDRAWLYGSGENELFVGSLASSRMSGDGFQNEAEGFDSVKAYASGASAHAVLHVAPQDTLTVDLPTATLVRDEYFVAIAGFSTLDAISEAETTQHFTAAVDLLFEHYK